MTPISRQKRPVCSRCPSLTPGQPLCFVTFKLGAIRHIPKHRALSAEKPRKLSQTLAPGVLSTSDAVLGLARSKFRNATVFHTFSPKILICHVPVHINIHRHKGNEAVWVQPVHKSRSYLSPLKCLSCFQLLLC